MIGTNKRRRLGALTSAAACLAALVILPVASAGAQVDEPDDDVTIDLDVDTAVFSEGGDGPDTVTFRGVDKYASLDGSAESFPTDDAITVMNADIDGVIDIIFFPTQPAEGDDAFDAQLRNVRSDDGEITADVVLIGDDGAPDSDQTLPDEKVHDATLTAVVDEPTVPAPDEGAPLGSSLDGTPATVILRSEGFEYRTSVELTGLPPSCILSPSTEKIGLDDSPSTDPWTFTWADKSTCTRGSYQLIYGKRDVIVSFAFDEKYGLFGIITSGCTSNAKCTVRGGINKITIDVTKK